jgi:1,4-alpha-glucan branching enzyme
MFYRWSSLSPYAIKLTLRYSMLYTGEGEGFRTDEQVYDEMYAYFKNNRKGRRKHHHKMPST